MFYILDSEPSSFNNLIAPCNQITYLYSVGLKTGNGKTTISCEHKNNSIVHLVLYNSIVHVVLYNSIGHVVLYNSIAHVVLYNSIVHVVLYNSIVNVVLYNSMVHVVYCTTV